MGRSLGAGYWVRAFAGTTGDGAGRSIFMVMTDGGVTVQSWLEGCPRSPLWIPAFAGMTVACGCAHWELAHEV